MTRSAVYYIGRKIGDATVVQYLPVRGEVKNPRVVLEFPCGCQTTVWISVARKWLTGQHKLPVCRTCTSPKKIAVTLGLSEQLIAERRRKGWSPHRAMTTPKRKYQKQKPH